jgi:hypothetical protein
MADDLFGGTGSPRPQPTSGIENSVFPQFILPPDAVPVTLEQTLDADDEA